MGVTHRVKSGEHMASIAVQYGFGDWRLIYDAPANKALRDKRPDPNLVCEGDEIAIPDKRVRAAVLQAKKRHRFKLTSPSARITLELQNADGSPMSGFPYDLKLGEATANGTLGQDGKIDHEVPGSIKEAELLIYINKEKKQVLARRHLRVGGLDPLGENTGLQARLNNLGFLCGEVDGDVGTFTARALAAFQMINGLKATGEADETTMNKLKELHGS